MTSAVERNIASLTKQVALLESRLTDAAEAIRTLEQLYELIVAQLPDRKRRNGQRETIPARSD